MAVVGNLVARLMVNSAGFTAGMTAAAGTTARLGVTASGTSGALAGLTGTETTAAAGAAKLTATATTASAALAKMAGAAGAAAVGVGSLAVRMKAAAVAAWTMLKSMLPMIAAFAALLAVWKAVTTAEQFNQAMRSSLAIMGDVTEHQAAMAQVAKQVAFDTKFSNKEAAESYFFLASAGLDAQQSMAALPFTAKFAQAGMFDMALATDLLTDAQSALGLTVKDSAQNLKNMARVGDVLVKANTLANASVQQFSEALTHKAAAAGRVAGKSIEEVVSVLAALADQGVKAQNAGTALNIILRELQGKSLANVAAFEKFGVTVWESSGAMRHMADIIADLENAMEGMSAKQKKAMLMQLGFQAKSVIFIQTLLGTSDKIRGYNEELDKAGGITEEVAGKQLPAFTDAMKKLWNIIGRIAILGFGPILEVIGHTLLLILTPINLVLTAFEKLAAFLAGEISKRFAEMGKELLRVAEYWGLVSREVDSTKDKMTAAAEVMGDVTDDEIPEHIQSMNKWIAAIQNEADVYGMTARQIELYKHAKAGAFKAGDITRAREAIAHLESLEASTKAMKEQESMMESLRSRGQSVFESMRTPLETYNASLADLNHLVVMGAIDWMTYGRAVKKAIDDLQKATGQKDILAPRAIQRGTQEAFTAELKFKAKDNVVATKLDKQIAIQREMLGVQQQQLEELQEQNEPVVVQI